MQKYKATPGSEVIGSAMHNFFISLNREEFESIVAGAMQDAGITEFRDDEWYSFQLTLDIFKEISQGGKLSQNLVALGLAYVETATFPPEANTIEAALMLLPVVYHVNIRNIPENEDYEVVRVADNHIRVIDYNPFPHDTVYGFVWGISNRFKGETIGATVVRTYNNEADPDSDGAVYDITWE